MEIVIAGGGQTGQDLCNEFSSSLNVILIEQNPDLVEAALNEFDIEAIIGSADDINIQREARVNSSDIFIAVTNSDEVNIISCIIAKNLGAKYTIARIREPEFMDSAWFIKDKVGVSHIINPNMEAAQKIREVIKFEEADDIEYFIDGRLHLVSFYLDNDVDLVGKHLYEIGWKDDNLLIGIVEREDELIIPSGSTVLQEGDKIYVTGDRETITDFYKKINIDSKEIKSIFIIGGSRTAYYLLKSINLKNKDVKLVESNLQRAQEFANDFPEIVVIYGDGTSQELLSDENIAFYDCVITLTGNDEENLMTSLFARHMDIYKTITKIKNYNLLKLLNHVEIGTTFNQKRILVDTISQIVRSKSSGGHSKTKNIYTIAGGKAIAIEFEVEEGNKWCRAPLKELGVKEGVLVAGLCRDKEIIIPNGDFQIQAGDTIVIITGHTEFEELEGIIENE